MSLAKSYRLDACRGAHHCHYAVLNAAELTQKITQLLERYCSKEDVTHVHSLLRVALACCPNSCSQPQIRDFGLQARMYPVVNREACSHCGHCVTVCNESALVLDEKVGLTIGEACLGCGQCISSCPLGALRSEKQGWTLLVGGKLGRHPRLASKKADYMTDEEVLATIENVLNKYSSEANPGERLGAWLERTKLELSAI